MTHKVGNTLFIQHEPPAKCELCGTVAELRPYGPKGEKICFDCGAKDVKAVNAAIDKLLKGAGVAYLTTPDKTKH